METHMLPSKKYFVFLYDVLTSRTLFQEIETFCVSTSNLHVLVLPEISQTKKQWKIVMKYKIKQYFHLTCFLSSLVANDVNRTLFH